MFTLLDFPLSTISKLSAASYPEGQGAVASGSNKTGILFSTGPVLTLQGIFIAPPLGMVTFPLVVFDGTKFCFLDLLDKIDKYLGVLQVKVSKFRVHIGHLAL